MKLKQYRHNGHFLLFWSLILLSKCKINNILINGKQTSESLVVITIENKLISTKVNKNFVKTYSNLNVTLYE